MKNNLLLGILTLIIALCVNFSIHADEFIISTCDFESLKSAVDDANLAGGTIRFECSGIITFSHPLILLNTIVFDGNETVIFDGDKKTHFMEIDNMATVSIDSITFQNSYSETFNATIINRNYSILNITNSIFRNNDSSAIWNREDADLNINNSQFIDNNLAKQVGKNGGAILNSLGYVNIRSSQFTNNHVIGAGGAIFIEYGNLYIFDSEFNNNSAIGSGGGAIWNSEGTVRIINNTFTSNMGSHGGAIFNSGRMNVDDTIFTNNNAIEEGGAIYNLGNSTIRNTNFIHNKAPIGGAIAHNFGWVSIQGGIFSDNSAINGGGIFNKNEILKVQRSLFIDNLAKGGGGAIHNNGMMNVENTIFILNSGNSGGAIVNFGNTNAIHNTFINNFARRGAVIYHQVFTNFKYNLIISRRNFSCFGQWYGNLLVDETNFTNIDHCVEATIIENLVSYESTNFNSPIIDAYPAPCAVDTDQMGIPRPQGDGCDIGAVEYQR